VPDILEIVIFRLKTSAGLVAMTALLAVVLVACHKEEQAFVGAAKSAVNAEHQAQVAAQARASTREQQREALARIPLPTKSMYIDVHDPSAWNNPFLAVGPESITLRILQADANTSDVGKGTMLRPAAARRQEIEIRPKDLSDAMVAVPQAAWQYGRVVAVAELPGAQAKERTKIRRNVEAAIKQLNDLGIVVEEWPNR
jgi:hypothetical protein